MRLSSSWRARSRAREGQPPFVLLAVVALASALALLVATADGLVVTSDSVVFLDAARNLANGNGLVVSGSYPNLEPTLRNDQEFPFVHWPPLYPSAIAAIDLGGVDPASGARWLQALLLGLNVALFGLITWQLAFSRAGAAVGAAVFAVSPAGLMRHVDLATEPLFLFLTFLGFELLARYLTGSRTRWLVAAVVALSLALLTRYAGLPIIVVLFGSLSLFGAGPRRRRFFVAGGAVIAASAPLAVWLVRNTVEAGTATGRSEIGWHPPGRAEVESAIGHAAAWFASTGLPAPARAITALAVGALVVFGVRANGFRPLVASPGRRVRALTLAAFAIVYLAFLFTSRTIADAWNPLNDRGFAPAYMAFALLVTAVAVYSFRGARGRRASPAALACTAGVVLVTVAYVANTLGVARAVDTAGYGGDRWRDSPTLAAVRRLNTTRPVYSNDPEAISFNTGRRAITIPVRTDPIPDRPYELFDEDLNRLRTAALRRHAVVVMFRDDDRPYLPDQQELIALTGVKLLKTFRDGAILGAP